MRILQLITSLRVGGAERLALELTRRLRGEGHHADLAIFDGTETPLLSEARRAGVEPVILGMGARSMRSPLHIPRLRRLMKGYDIVHTHNFAPQLYAAVARRGLTTRLVTTEHNTDNRRRDSALGAWIDRWMYGRYSLIACCSEEVNAALRRSLHSVDTPTVTVENGIDLTPYLSLPPADMTLRNILMVSAFRKQKDHLTALRALSRLPADVTMTFAGDGAYIYRVRQQADELGVAARVRFTGNVADIPALYRLASVALLSTHYEGLSLSTIEAMASGRPLVASDVPGVTGNVADGAALVPEGDDRAMASAISRLLASPARAADLAARGRQRAARFDVRNTVTAYINHYKSILT